MVNTRTIEMIMEFHRSVEQRERPTMTTDNEGLLPCPLTDETHKAHCFQGDYLNTCKYGDDDCPAALTRPAPADVGELEAELAKLDNPRACIGKGQYIPIHRDTLRRILTALRGAQGWREALPLERMLCDLLAIIQRDGGHRTDEVGIEQSWMEAMMLVPFYLQAVDDAPLPPAPEAGHE